MGFDPSPYKTVALGRDRCNSVSLLLMWIQWHFLKVSNFGVSEIVTRWFFGHQGTPQKIGPLSSGCVRHPCWLMIGSRVVQPHILAMIRMRGFTDSLFTKMEWHFRIWALWNMLLTSPSRPFASICTLCRRRWWQWLHAKRPLSGQPLSSSPRVSQTGRGFTTVQRWRLHSSIWCKSGRKRRAEWIMNFNAFDWH